MQKGERNMLKVLLVDDEPFIIQGLKVLIDWEQEGYMIAGTASNGKEAYDFLKKESVDLIIADIQMPVMTGLDLQEAIRKENLSNSQDTAFSMNDTPLPLTVWAMMTVGFPFAACAWCSAAPMAS